MGVGMSLLIATGVSALICPVADGFCCKPPQAVKARQAARPTGSGGITKVRKRVPDQKE